MHEVRVPVISSARRHPEPNLRRTGSRGGARLKAIIWLLILGAAVYVCYKVIPIYLNNYQLEDRMQTEARFAVVNRKSEEAIRDVVYREIQERDIPARREDIRVQSTQRNVHISVDYTVTVDLRVYQLHLHFTPTVDAQALY